MARRAGLCMLVLLLLAACLSPGPPVVVNPTTSATLPTTFKQGVFLATVRIDGVTRGPFVIDTGASDVIVDVELAEALRLRYEGTSRQSELGQTVKLATVKALEVGPVVLRNTRVVVLDLSSVSAGLGERVAGVLGHPFFAAAVVEVDYPHHSVRGFAAKAYRLPRGEWKPLTLKGPHPGVMARLDGNAEGLFLLDTGSTYTVYFLAPFVERNGLLEIRGTSKTKVVRVSGEHDVFTGRISWFEVGGRRFESPSVFFSGPGTPVTEVARRFDGIIGYGLLREFVVVFDYPSARVALLGR
jgi:Aspartyl protease